MSVRIFSLPRETKRTNTFWTQQELWKKERVKKYKRRSLSVNKKIKGQEGMVRTLPILKGGGIEGSMGGRFRRSLGEGSLKVLSVLKMKDRCEG